MTNTGLQKTNNVVTECRNQRSMELDNLSTEGILKLINDEDRKVAEAVGKEISQIAAAVELIVAAIKNGGRLFYIGAGTSGRLGILDASEAPPTFGVDPELIQGIIAGGYDAIFRAIENMEDNVEQGGQDLLARGFNSKDIVVGIAASGRTPYVLGALQKAKEIGAKTIALVSNKDTPLCEAADVAIAVVVGPEVLTGSTRMKAGTAHKMVLNMLSTTVMIRLGKVYQNLMIDMRPTNQKLRERAVNMITTLASIEPETAWSLLKNSNFNIKTALVMAETGLSLDVAEKILMESDGMLTEAIRLAKNKSSDTDTQGGETAAIQ